MRHWDQIHYLMQVELRYGRGFLPVKIPDRNRVTVLRKSAMPVIAEPARAVCNALRNPLGTASLDELAQNASTACIAICDVTRPVPNHLFLRPLIEMLLGAGIPATGITVLVATGLHRPNEGRELEELIGDSWVLDTVAVANHFARRDQEHVYIGTTSQRGTVVRLDRRFAEADIRIATGLVEPHFMAGYSGGRKVIAPGLAHAETITTFHSARFMADPAAANCNLENNPLHEEQVEIVEMLGGALALNTVVDEDRRLSFVNFGEIVATHQAAVEFVREYCEIPVQRKFATVITSAAGYPLDNTYYQTVKGMVGPMDILQRGGDLVIASACSEGMGSVEFARAQRRLVEVGSTQFLEEIHGKSHADIDEWQTQMQLKPMSVGNIHLMSDGLTDEEFRQTGVHRIDSIDEFLQRRDGENDIAVIPEGPYVVPIFGG